MDLRLQFYALIGGVAVTLEPDDPESRAPGDIETIEAED